jgi:hypothetical protein
MTLRTWLDNLDAPKTIEGVFDPRIQVSADAKYIVRSLVIWFFVVPLVLGALFWLITRQ